LTNPYGDPTLLPKGARARRADPPESHAAAASVTDLTRKQTAVLECLLLQAAPQTDYAIAADYLGQADAYLWPEQSPSGLRTRRAELVARGLVIRAGIGVLPTGRKAARWTTAPGAWGKR